MPLSYMLLLGGNSVIDGSTIINGGIDQYDKSENNSNDSMYFTYDDDSDNPSLNTPENPRLN